MTETLEELDARLRADWQARQAPAKAVADMSEGERREALAALSRPAPPPVVAPFQGQHLRDLSPQQRREAARQLGISHISRSFR